MIAQALMATDDLDFTLGRIEQALTRLETVVAARAADAVDGQRAAAELSELQSRHRTLKDTVTQELRQLDLLLAGLPQ